MKDYCNCNSSAPEDTWTDVNGVIVSCWTDVDGVVTSCVCPIHGEFAFHALALEKLDEILQDKKEGSRGAQVAATPSAASSDDAVLPTDSIVPLARYIVNSSRDSEGISISAQCSHCTWRYTCDSTANMCARAAAHRHRYQHDVGIIATVDISLACPIDNDDTITKEKG